MQRPSRTMPPSPTKQTNLIGWLILALFIAVLMFGVVTHPYFVLAFFAFFALVTVWSSIQYNRHMVRLSANRPGESICTFGRGFDYRSIDTWILRAVHEELQPFCRFRGGSLPLRATDELDRDLRIDSDDLDYVVERIAERTGRPLDAAERNPYYGRVHTVANLVHFFNHQPLVRPR